MADVLGRIRLEEILERVTPLAVLGSVRGVEISAVVFDHREVVSGSLFCCLPGAHHDGHEFAHDARLSGAVAFICEHSLGYEAAGAVQLVVAPGTAREAMAKAACAFYGDPAAQLATVAVTGTNGKTTTTYLIRSILERHGWRTGVVGTLDGARTTPESPHLQRALARQRAAGCAASAIEVTSHALVQHRVDGIRFDVGVFTNLTQDHLDFHETMEAYFEAKAMLFTPERVRCAVVNIDDPYGRRLADHPLVPTIPFSLADVRGLSLGLTESRFRLGGYPVTLGLGGEFNVYNALGAAAAARSLGVEAEEIVAGLESAARVPGRFEVVESDEGVTVLVDYAHTPAGLEQVLLAARVGVANAADEQNDRARVFVVFGSGGDRDRGKRPAMGAVASRLADHVVITTDNPRGEDPLAIIEEVRAGATRGATVEIEPDRRAAIARALRAARRGDVVVVAGKGHETTQQFADHLERFDDREVVGEELARLGRSRRQQDPNAEYAP